jgi:DNA helicase-2/ATP-dependent DNA helicase PcrA
LRAEGVVDYGDLIMQSVAALRLPEVAREVHAHYQYILVDEFQDINYASGTLVALLDGGRGVVWAVGDPWQSIYRFRGASVANLAEFSTIYPAATTASLVRNYRSVQNVLDASQAVMLGDPLAGSRTVQQAQRHTQQRHVVEEWAVADQAAEYAAIAHDVLRRVGGRLYRATWCAHRRWRKGRRVRAPQPVRRTRRPRFGDHAVLCRTHAQVANVVAALEAHGIPVDGGGELLDYPEVKDTLAICALARSLNSVGMLRALTLPEYRLSVDDLELLVRNADAERRSLQRAIRDETIVRDLSDEGQATLQRLADLHDDLATEADAWRVLARYLFDLSATMRERINRAACGDALARRELANIGQLLLLARNFVRQALSGTRDASAFIAYVRLLIEAGEAPKAAPLAGGADAVRVMTIHAAKGLEFKSVYVPGVQKDVFPPRNQGSVIPEIGGLVHGPLGDEQAEERYLLYVAMTRAQDRLVLSRATEKAGKAIARSVLLPHDAPWKVRSISAQPACRSRRGETRLRGVPVQQMLVAATSIDTYEKCPRRYLYQYGYQLYDDATPFLRMHQAIRDVIDELTELAQEGTLPSDEDVLERLVWQWFRRHELDDVLYKDDYFSETFRHVERIWRDLRDDPTVAQAANQRFVVQRPSGQVTVRVDRVEETAEGVRYVQLKSGRPGKDDHLSTRIMLYTLAAQTHHPNATLAIHYTATNATRSVEQRKSTLENHTAKIDATLAGIAAQSWEPNYGEQCDTCPFNLICPV